MTRNKQKSIDRLRQWITNEGSIELTPHDEEVWERISLLRSLFTKRAFSVQDALPYWQKTFPHLSVPTFYRDVRDCLKLFGDIFRSQKEGQRYMMYELGMRIFQAAAKEGDHRAMASAHNNMIRLLGLDRDDPDMPDFSKLQPSLIVTLLPKGMEDKIDQLLAGGVVNMNDLPGPTPTEDAEYEEIDSRTGK